MDSGAPDRKRIESRRTGPRIGIDALPLLGDGGISNFIRPLIHELIRIRGGTWNFELLFRLGPFRARAAKFIERSGSAMPAGAAVRPTRLPDRLAVLFAMNGGGAFRFFPRLPAADLFLATTELVPRGGRTRVGWFVYDLIPVKLPQYFPGFAERWRKKMDRGAQKADFIVALSECTRRDVIEMFDYPAERVTVVYPGAPAAMDAEQAPMAPALNGRPYVLYLGALARNKNVDGLLRVFARCVHGHGADIDLVLTGKDFVGEGYWRGLAEELRVASRVRFLGWVSDSVREALLARAVMLWQFSWYEGFGLPVLEAAARGVPVLHTNRGAVPEILRNPAQEVDPADEAGAAERAAQALQSPATLQAWREHGLRRAAAFTWRDSAMRLARAIEACAP